MSTHAVLTWHFRHGASFAHLGTAADCRAESRRIATDPADARHVEGVARIGSPAWQRHYRAVYGFCPFMGERSAHRV